MTDPTSPPSPVQPPSRGRAEPAMHIIRRADGEEMGEFAFFATDGPEGWDVAENADHDDDTVYEILACYPVSRRKFLWSTLCETCDGEGDGCPACGGSGECEPPDTEHLPGPAADVQVAPPRDEDAERKPLVYVAGPITGDPFGCVRQAMAAFQMIRHAGCVPFLPQLSVIGEMVEPQDYEAWMAYDFDVIDHCDALYRLRGDSAGADREVDHARSLGLPVLGLDGQDWPALCALTTRTPPPAPAVPVEQAGRRIEDLPEWAALVEAVNDDGGTVANYRATVTGRAASLTRAVRALAAAPSPATEPASDRPRLCVECTFDDCNEAGRCLAAPPPAAPAVSPEPGHDGHTHDVGPVKVWRCILSAPDCLGVDDANRLHIGCGWVDAVPSPEPERDEHASRADAIAAARWDSGGDDGEDAQMERQYERDHGIEP